MRETPPAKLALITKAHVQRRMQTNAVIPKNTVPALC
jgi:hypothetical protein